MAKSINKIITSILSLTLITSLSSCGDKKNSSSENNSSSSTSTISPVLKDCPITENTIFGSATVLISINDFNDLGFCLGDSCDVTFSNGFSLADVPYYNGYYVKNGEAVIVAYPSDEYISVTFNNVGIWDNAFLSEDDTVTITLNESNKYIATQEALGQSYSLDRVDYSSNEEFSNFRVLKGGNLKDNLIYRGASPVDNSRNRAKITDSLLLENDIECIIDLADTELTLNSYFEKEDFASEYTQNIYDNDKMILLGMGSSYSSIQYAQKVVEGFKFMLNNQGPYYVHCMEGKDRTGFVCFLIEALAGATYQEMKEDYMTTYYNYYKISSTKTPEKYEAVVSLYFDSFVECLHGTNDTDKYETLSLVDDAKEYLSLAGMSQEDIQSFITLISK